MLEPFQYYDWVGASGVSLLLIAFALNVYGILDRRSLMYSAMNAVGAGLAAYASWLIFYLPFLVREGTWCLVSVIAMTAFVRRSYGADSTNRAAS
ncbi:MAG: CBU_0592 family membrane protein [Henriciella sp.]